MDLVSRHEFTVSYSFHLCSLLKRKSIKDEGTGLVDLDSFVQQCVNAAELDIYKQISFLI